AETMQAALLAAAQRQVRQREELYQVFEQAPAAIVLLRAPDHRIEYVNPAYAQLFPGVALRGRLLAEAHPGIVASGVLAHLDRVYETGEPYVGEEQPVELLPVPGQPAQTHYFNFTYQPYREEGRTVGVSIFAYDVTSGVLARRAATQALEQRRGELQRIFEQAPVAIFVLRGVQYVLEVVNPLMGEMLGRPAGALLGRPYFEAVPELASQGYPELLAQVWHTGQAVTVQESPARLARHEPNETGYFNFVYQPLYDGSQLVAVLCVAVEVTDQVLARRQVEQLNHELETRVRERTREVQAARAEAERQRALLQAMFAQAPVAIALFQGEEIRVTAANPMMAATWGYTPEQVIGRPLVEGVPELRGQGFDDLLRQVLTTRVPVTGTETPATMRRAGQLKTTYYNFVYQPLYSAEGEVLGVIDVATEVTEQVEARRQVEQLNQELESRVLERTRQLSEQQALLRQILGQVPASIATLSGPEHRFSFFNELYQSLSSNRTELGLTAAEVLPEVVAQGFIDLLDRVYLTGEPFVGTDMAAELYDTQLGHNRRYYIDFIYQPLFDGQRRVQGILAFILDVTDRVLARQQAEESQVRVQELNEELAGINEELRATNEELHTSNSRLVRTNTDLDTFVYTASHDLKAPINNIEGLLNALRDYLPTDADADPTAMVPRLLK
ncbi:MAG: PAS domain S-box protein, partial [Hymenobacter sp.]